MSSLDYGPFAPVVGYAGMIMATAAAVFALWGGRMEKWRPPDEDLPGTAQAIVLLLCGIGIVLMWSYASPDTLRTLLAMTVVFAIVCLLGFIHYRGLLASYVYVVKIATGDATTRDVRILGGRQLLPEAEMVRAKNRVTVQVLLEGAAYQPDSLWSRESREWVKRRVVIFFILTLVTGTWALVGASIATQAIISAMPPESALVGSPK